MANSDFMRRSFAVILMVAFVALTIVFTRELWSVLMLVLTTCLVAAGLDIPVVFFTRRGLGRTLALVLSVVLLAVVFGAIFALVVPPVVEELAQLIASMPEAIEAVLGLDSALYKLSDLRAPEPGSEQEILHRIINSALPVVVEVGGLVSSVFVSALFVLITAFYLTLRPQTYYRLVVALVPAQHERRALEIVSQLRRTAGGWIMSMVATFSFASVCVSLVLGPVLHVPLALALGVLAGFGTLIPYVGYWVCLIPIMIYALASSGPTTALVALIAYLIIGAVNDYVIGVKVVHEALAVPPAITLAFQLVGSAALGFFGLLLAVPLSGMVLVLVRELYVHDTLGKRQGVPPVVETATGELLLE